MRAQIDLLLEFCASVVSGTRMLTSVLALVPDGSERYGCPLRTPPWVPSSLRSILLFVSPTTSPPGPSPSNLPCGHGPSLSGDDHVFSLPFVSGMRWLTWLGFHTLNHSCVHGIHSTQSYCIILFHVLVELVCWNLDEEIRVCIQRSYGGPFLWCLWF